MVRTRSQSHTKKRAPLNYAELADIAPKNRQSPSKRATSTSATSSPTRKTPRHKSMASSSVAADEVVKSENEEGDAERLNGNDVDKRPRSSRKGVKSTIGEAKVKGKPAHKVDKSGNFEFGGTLGTGAMMTFFPLLMYYLWICSTFYGGSLEGKRGSETWLAFIDRMVAHITKVQEQLLITRLMTGCISKSQCLGILLGIHHYRRDFLRHSPRRPSPRPSNATQP